MTGQKLSQWNDVWATSPLAKRRSFLSPLLSQLPSNLWHLGTEEDLEIGTKLTQRGKQTKNKKTERVGSQGQRECPGWWGLWFYWSARGYTLSRTLKEWFKHIPSVFIAPLSSNLIQKMYRWRKWGSEMLCDLFKVPLPVRGGAKTETSNPTWISTIYPTSLVSRSAGFIFRKHRGSQRSQEPEVGRNVLWRVLIKSTL